MNEQSHFHLVMLSPLPYNEARMSEAGPSHLDIRLLRAAGWQDEVIADLKQAIAICAETGAEIWKFCEW